VLYPRLDASKLTKDVSEYRARALGNAIHDSIEKAWRKGYKKALKKLGHPDSLIERVRIDPTDEELKADPTIIPLFMENRIYRTIIVNGVSYRIGGKYDGVFEGGVNDTKSTSSWEWVFARKSEDYVVQKSIYRWIDAGQPIPKITDDVGRINFVFTDWQKSKAAQDPDYPQLGVAHRDFVLWPVAQTEAWIRNRISRIQMYKHSDEENIPECTPEELWMSEPVHKYYSDANKTTGKSTRNFKLLSEATQMQADKGKGIVISVPGEAKRCAYCEVASICSKKEKYTA
jgi:hypothetical protein